MRSKHNGIIYAQSTKRLSCDCTIVVVVIQFLFGVVPLTEMAGFTPFLLQLLALGPSTCLVSRHPPSSNQSSLSPLPLASSRSSSVVLAFSCHSLQDPEQPSKHSSSLLSIGSYHLTPFAVANRSTVSFNPNMCICSSVVFLSTTF